MAAVILPAGAEVTLGQVVVQPGQVTAVTLDRTVSPNAVSAKPLSQLTAQTTVTVRVYASADGGASWYQVAGCTQIAGSYTDPVTGVTSASGVLSVSAAPGEVQHRATATMTSSAAVSRAGIGATVAGSS